MICVFILKSGRFFQGVFLVGVYTIYRYSCQYKIPHIDIQARNPSELIDTLPARPYIEKQKMKIDKTIGANKLTVAGVDRNSHNNHRHWKGNLNEDFH